VTSKNYLGDAAAGGGSERRDAIAKLAGDTDVTWDSKWPSVPAQRWQVFGEEVD
jgi:hypothetical protein